MLQKISRSFLLVALILSLALPAFADYAPASSYISARGETTTTTEQSYQIYAYVQKSEIDENADSIYFYHNDGDKQEMGISGDDADYFEYEHLPVDLVNGLNKIAITHEQGGAEVEKIEYEVLYHTEGEEAFISERRSLIDLNSINNGVYLNIARMGDDFVDEEVSYKFNDGEWLPTEISGEGDGYEEREMLEVDKLELSEGPATLTYRRDLTYADTELDNKVTEYEYSVVLYDEFFDNVNGGSLLAGESDLELDLHVPYSAYTINNTLEVELEPTGAKTTLSDPFPNATKMTTAFGESFDISGPEFDENFNVIVTNKQVFSDGTERTETKTLRYVYQDQPEEDNNDDENEDDNEDDMTDYQFTHPECEFVDVDFDSLAITDNEVHRYLIELCDDKQWFTGDDREVTVAGRTGRQVRLADFINRAEFTKLAVFGPGGVDVDSLETNVTTEFNDVPARQWYTGLVKYAADQEWVTGDKNADGTKVGTFRPGGNINLAEALVLSLRIADVDTSGACDGGLDDDLKVTADSQAWYKDAACFAVTNELVRINQSNPNFGTPATRGQVVYLLGRLLELNLIN